MNRKTSKILSILAGIAFVGAGYASAQSCDPMPACGPKMIDTNNYGVMFGTCGQETKKLVFCGLIQTDYNFIRVEDDKVNGTAGGGNASVTVTDPTDRNNFLMRRVRVGFDADLGNGWRGVVVMHFSGVREKRLYEADAAATTLTVANTYVTTRNKHGIFGIHNAYIEKMYGGNSFKAGYKKVNFGREENLFAGDLKTIERSIANEYFNACCQLGNISGSPLGMGSRHVGLFMDGEYRGIGYGVAVVNGFQGNALSNLQNNELGIFGNIYYTGEFNCIDLQVGINAGYKPKGNNCFLAGVHNGTAATRQLQRGSIGAINPYIMASWQKFGVLAEFLGSDVEHGAVDSVRDAKPYGFTIIPSFMVNDQLELVGRYSYVDTDFRGMNICSTVPGADNTSSIAGGAFPGTAPGTSGGDIYDNATAWYAGFNYYMMNRAVKFSAGYEYFQFKDRQRGLTSPAVVTEFQGDKARVHAARARIQLVF